MENLNQEFTEAQIEEFKESIINQKPVPISIAMGKEAFRFIIDKLNILNHEKYKTENNITIVKDSSTLNKYQARVTYSDNHSETISVYESV